MNIIKIIIVFTLILLIISHLIKTEKINTSKEKLSVFECGFDPEHKIRTRFSLRFFITTIIFLIFDIELSIIFPLPIVEHLYNFNTFMLTTLTILILLLIGLLFEWYQGALKWAWFFI